MEADPAFERRFQQVLVNEPTVEDTVSILRGLKDKSVAGTDRKMKQMRCTVVDVR